MTEQYSTEQNTTPHPGVHRWWFNPSEGQHKTLHNSTLQYITVHYRTQQHTTVALSHLQWASGKFKKGEN